MRKIKSAKTQKNLNKNLIIDTLSTIFIFFIMLIIISNPKRFTSGTISGLKLFFYSVLPGLFPFMILTKLLTEIGFLFRLTQKFDKFSYKMFGTPGVSLYGFLMSILSGYPIGAKIISDLYNKQLISENDAKKMSVFCTTSGPIFIIGAVGTAMFKSFKIGLILYFSHIISSLILGILFNILTKERNKLIDSRYKVVFEKKTGIISTAVTETINSLFVVGAYITIFYLLSEILDNFKVLDTLTSLIQPIFQKLKLSKTTTKGLLYGILEVTRGAKEISANISPISIAITCGVLSFSGLSIIMQSMAFLKTCKIKAHGFVLTKCVHACLSIFVCYLILIIC